MIGRACLGSDGVDLVGWVAGIGDNIDSLTSDDNLLSLSGSVGLLRLFCELDSEATDEAGAKQGQEGNVDGKDDETNEDVSGLCGATIHFTNYDAVVNPQADLDEKNKDFKAEHSERDFPVENVVAEEDCCGASCTKDNGPDINKRIRISIGYDDSDDCEDGH